MVTSLEKVSQLLSLSYGFSVLFSTQQGVLLPNIPQRKAKQTRRRFLPFLMVCHNNRLSHSKMSYLMNRE